MEYKEINNICWLLKRQIQFINLNDFLRAKQLNKLPSVNEFQFQGVL